VDVSGQHCSSAALPLGSPTGEPGEDSLAETSWREKDSTVYRVPFLDPEDMKILCLGSFWIFVKGQGSPELVSVYGAQRVCL
jgi:hypothetical protein